MGSAVEKRFLRLKLYKRSPSSCFGGKDKTHLQSGGENKERTQHRSLWSTHRQQPQGQCKGEL